VSDAGVPNENDGGEPPRKTQACAPSNTDVPPPQAQKSKDDLQRAQTRAANWTTGATVAIAFFAAATFVVGIAQWCVLNGTLNEMRDEQRPWVGAPVSVVGEIASDGSFVLSIEMENAGRLPTNNLGVDAHIVQGDEYRWIAESKLICPDLATKTVGNTLSLIPHSKWLVPSDLVPSKIKNLKAADLRTMENPFLAGCVAYTFDGSNAVHHTEFGAHLKVDGGRVVADRIYAADAN
jgi:hypothetical protein